uniref:Jacalin-type lectin domain-containing protein n=1 Tax=Angiostrongylus cantonensis TaxID=6313 RepID=A0A0K0DNX4_ANGCA
MILRLQLLHQENGSIINSYSLTATSDENELESSYIPSEEAVHNEFFCKFFVRNFNARIGRDNENGHRVGKLGAGDRREDGTILQQFDHGTCSVIIQFSRREKILGPTFC